MRIAANTEWRTEGEGVTGCEYGGPLPKNAWNGSPFTGWKMEVHLKIPLRCNEFAVASTIMQCKLE